MDALAVGQKLVDLFNKGDYETIYSTLYSPDIVSVENSGNEQEFVGMAAINAKNEWWNSMFETHGFKMEGPFPHGSSFAVIIDMDITEKASGTRFPMREVGVYEVADGKIVKERFFYAREE